MFKVKYLLVVPLLLIGCESGSDFSGFSYDPPDVTDTEDKITEPQKRRTIGAGSPKVWVSNEFEGARLSDFYRTESSMFEILIKPENAPINNSPWYSFDIWSDSARVITLSLAYEGGEHRYIPKVYSRYSEGSFSTIDSIAVDSTTGTASFSISLDTTPVTISAQYLEGIRFSDLTEELSSLPSFVSIDTAGYSHQHRPVLELEVNETGAQQSAGVLILLSRQHPPEISGYLTYRYFFDTLLDTTELAEEFRNQFVIKAYPIVNPDGVVNGHWRYNAAGIDLNRDWENFNQPETKAIRDALLPLKEDSARTVLYAIDFHSTNENIFYPIDEEVKTVPDNFTQHWIPQIIELNPDLIFAVEEFDTSSPISKNWIYKTFNADALTYEVHDELSREQIKQLAETSAKTLMQSLLKEWYNSD